MKRFRANMNIHYDDVIMTMLASQITSFTVVYSIVYSGVNQRKHQSSASLAFVREIHRGPLNFPHKWPVTRKIFPFDDVIMNNSHKIKVTSGTESVNIHINLKIYVIWMDLKHAMELVFYIWKKELVFYMYKKTGYICVICHICLSPDGLLSRQSILYNSIWWW